MVFKSKWTRIEMIDYEEKMFCTVQLGIGSHINTII